MTNEEKQELQRLREKDHLEEKEFVRYEYLLKEEELEPRALQFRANQKASYEEKISRAGNLAWEFYNQVGGQCYVSVGGLDSITLYLFLRKEGINVPAVSVSVLEDKSIQKIHKALGVIALKPEKTKIEVLREYGFPAISKETAGKISLLQKQSPKSATVRHAIITGETGKQGGYRKGTRMKMADKWLQLFGGYENEKEGTNFQKPDFLVSDKCCYYLKEKPCDRYAKESGRFPYFGLMASEGGRREKALIRNGCNYISEGTKRSAPFATFMRDDILRLAQEMNEWYLKHTDLFPGEPVESVIPEIYGEIVLGEDGKRKTTGAQRTGCSMCGFGVHMEKRPHRFDQLWKRNPKEWELWMHHIMQDQDGNWYGWDKVLDYIGVEWRNPERLYEEEKKVETI